MAVNQRAAVRKGCDSPDDARAVLPGLAILDADEVPLRASGIQLPRPADLIAAADHFAPVSNPARRASRGEDNGEHFNGNTDGFQDNT